MEEELRMAKKKKEKKTNEERVLDQNDIEYIETSYNWLEKGVLSEANDLGIEVDSILKTIVLQANKDPKDYVVVCLPITKEINLKLVAKQLGKKQLHLADNKKLINITGYVHGANTPIGIHAFKGFPIYFDERTKSFNEVSVSSGKVGRSVRLKLEDLVNLVDGKYIQVEE